MESTISTISNAFTATISPIIFDDFQSSMLWALIVGAIFAFLLGFGMGANDVSNAFGTSVGSKAVGLKTAYCMATVFETLGVILVGYNVSDTMRKLVVDIDLYAKQPKTLLVGQVAILAGGAAWLFIATLSKLPVSTTHSIVGATLGFSIVMKGFRGILWETVAEIVASWIISPALSGLISSLFYVLVDHLVLRRKNPVHAGFQVLPFFYFACLAFNTFAVTYQGSKIIGLSNVPLWLALTLAFVIGLASALIFHFIAKPFLLKWINNENQSLSTDAASSVEKGKKSEKQRLTSEKADDDTHEPNNPEANPSTENTKHHVQEFKLQPRGFIAWLFPLRDRVQDPKALKLFGSIQVFTACFAGFAHGANDVSNAIAPLAAIYSIYTTMDVHQKGETPVFILLFGVLSICVGLWILGHRVIRTIGQDMTEIHPASGFCIEFGAAVTTMVASKVGLPISTTHCLVGSVVAVGMVKSGKGINWALFRNVAISWVITLPVSGIISAVIMFFLKNAISEAL